MTRPRGELTTYRARGGHATDWANPTRFQRKANIQTILIRNEAILPAVISHLQFVENVTEAGEYKKRLNLYMKFSKLWIFVMKNRLREDCIFILIE